MSEPLIDVDDNALAEPAEALGTVAAHDTVNEALLEVVRFRRRANALAGLREMGARGDFDILLDKRNYRGESTPPS
ncbi:hypothetical protein [Streptomyces xinghaiensis]|uniref:hypothetical protein n=1 Tax=Streptomyces xinghaiensis TaxID=1038928 RepID=UPI0002F22A91|nr:hypothetical protein [Streptomyces xinghaiensis]